MLYTLLCALTILQTVMKSCATTYATLAQPIVYAHKFINLTI